MVDLISRQAAIDALGKEGLITAMVIIDRVPSAQPKPRKGKWIKRTSLFQCSACERFYTLKYNYCPNCGADMREEEDNAEIH